MKDILKMPIQILFLLCGLMALVGVGPFTYYVYKFIEQTHSNKPDNYIYPDWRDFAWTLLSVVVISIFDYIGYKVLNKLFRPYCKVQDDIEDRDRRTVKAAYSIFKFFYFVSVSTWGFVVLHDKKFFPSLLGGTGDLHRCYENFPYQKPEAREGLKMFIVLQLGYHV